MTAGTYTITIEQGGTFSLPLTWKDALGNLVDLTGYTARLHIREEIESSTAFITLTTENGGIAPGGTAGTVTLKLSAAATAALTQSKGVYDLELIGGSGVVTRLLEGLVVIRKEVTR